MEGPRVPPVLPRSKVRLVMAFPGRSVHMTHKYRMPGHDVFRNVLEISEAVTGPIPGTWAISSTSAARIFLTDPKCLSRSEEHTSELQSRGHLVCRLLLEKKKEVPDSRTDARM